MAATPTRPRVLAAASGGGHWVELLRVLPALPDCSLVLVTVREEYRSDLPRQAGAAFYTVNDATSWNPLGTLRLAARMLMLVWRIRPDVVISTGAAAGYFAVRFGKLLGARTIWIDSLANVEQLSRSGRMAGRYADLWLTQWPALAADDGPTYAGQVI